MAETSETPQSLEEAFKNFSKFGNTASDGTQLTLTQVDKWLKQAAVIDGKKITTTDTGIAFNKIQKGSKTMQYADFVKFVDDLAASKKMDPKNLKDKLALAKLPGTPNTTQATKVMFAQYSMLQVQLVEGWLGSSCSERSTKKLNICVCFKTYLCHNRYSEHKKVKLNRAIDCHHRVL